jgi:hypothetical protein
MLRPVRIGHRAVVTIAVVAFILQLGGRSSSKAEAAEVLRSAPDACGLLLATEATQLLGVASSSQAFTDFGFPVSPTAAPNASYSQCRFASTSKRSQIRLIINADLAKSPSVRVQAFAARAQPGGRVLTIDRALAVWQPWTQHDIRKQGGVLSSTKDGDYIAVVLIYVQRDPLRAAEDAMRIVLPKISNSS